MKSMARRMIMRVIESSLVILFAMSVTTIGVLAQSLISVPKTNINTPLVIEPISTTTHILTDEELSSLYICKPEVRRKDDTIQEFSYNDAQLLMHVARAEGGETLLGQLWAMRTIVNRLYSDSFPDTITEIVFQEGQFEVVSNGKYIEVDLNANSHIALAMIEGGWNETSGALYFESASNTQNSWHATNLVCIANVEGQRYYREQ